MTTHEWPTRTDDCETFAPPLDCHTAGMTLRDACPPCREAAVDPDNPRRLRSGALGLRTLMAALIGAVAVVLAGAGVHAMTAGQATVAAQPQLVTRGAIIMLGTSVHVHENTAHTALGSPRVELIPGQGRQRCHLNVYFDQNPGEKILNISATPDDKMVMQGITVGTAGGNGRVAVRLYRGLTSSGRPQPICASDWNIDDAANVWLQTTVLTDAPPTTPDPDPAPTTPPPTAAPAPAPTTEEAP